MRIMTLNNALKERNVWFRVTPEQAKQVSKLLNRDVKNVRAVTLAKSNNTFGFWSSESGLLRCYIHLASLEQIQIVDEVPFKTQKEVLEFLVSNAGNTVEHIEDGRKLTFINSQLMNVADIDDIHKYLTNFMDSHVWKPSTKLYRPEPKEWWELNGNKPALCRYSDSYTRVMTKQASIGICQREKDYFIEAADPSCAWNYAVPLTEEELKEFSFKPLEN